MKISSDIRKQGSFKENIGVFVWLPNRNGRASVPPHTRWPQKLQQQHLHAYLICGRKKSIMGWSRVCELKEIVDLCQFKKKTIEFAVNNTYPSMYPP